MPYRVEYNKDTEIIELINEGVFTASDLIGEVKEAHALGVDKATLRYLVDGTKREKLDLSMFDFYSVRGMLDKLLLDRRSRIALVLPKAQDSDEGMRFFETVCVNGGYETRTFSTREDAETWLLSR